LGTQEDSHELLACLLDVIHEDLNRVKQRPILNENDDSKNSLEKQAAEAWKNHLLRNRSIIVDLFQGQIKSSLKCHECGYVSHKFEPFMYLSLPIPEEKNKKQVTLYDCLEEFNVEEKLEQDEKWHCPKCKDFKDSSKKIDIWTLPNILIIHLKRFMFTRHKRGKIRTLIDFPLKDLDLSKFLGSKQKTKPTYDLFAISNHEGTLGGGHYTSYVKNRDNLQWYCMNDSYVREVDLSREKLVDSSAYVLFYSKTSVDEFYRQTITNPEAWPHFNKDTLNDVDHSLVMVDTPNITRKGDKNPQRFGRLRSNTQASVNSLNNLNISSNKNSIRISQVTNHNIQITNISMHGNSPCNNNLQSEDLTGRNSSCNDSTVPPNKKPKKMKQAIFVIPKENFLPNKGNIIPNKLQRMYTGDTHERRYDDRVFAERDFTAHHIKVNPNKHALYASEANHRFSGAPQKLSPRLEKIDDVDEPENKKSPYKLQYSQHNPDK
jgi:ubiquitin carboxyl-terminal hydrolase 8